MIKEYLHFETVTPLLKKILEQIMDEQLFSPFCLVGGTNLSLRHGHRRSVDIDLFTDAEYGTLDFTIFEDYLKSHFKYFECPSSCSPVSFGRSYYIGESKMQCIKLDLMYTGKFAYPIENFGSLRMADERDIIAMKLEAICTGGRKKDYWDLHYLLVTYSLDEMIQFYTNRNPYGYDKTSILNMIMVMSMLDDDFDPDCLLIKNWDDIKLDFLLAADACIKNS